MSMNGIDIASYQAGINLSVVPGDFVIVKATEGTNYINPYCNAQSEQTLNTGKKLGLYHFASGGNAVSEADYFVDNIEGYLGKALLVLDWEAEAISRGPAWAKQWLDRVYQRTGTKPLIYMSNSVVNGYDWSAVAAGDYGLWNAGYYAGYETMGYNPDAPLYGGLGAWGGCTIYQYTSSGRLNGWNGNLDLDVFYGDGAAWDAYVKGNKKVETTEKPIVKSEAVNVVLKDNNGADSTRWKIEKVGDYSRLTNKATGKVLDLSGASTKNDTNVQVYTPNGTDAQLWKLEKVTDGLAEYTAITPKLAPDKYVSVENNGLGGKDNIKIYGALNNSKQRFYLRKEKDGYYLLIHIYTQKAVAAS